MFSSWWEPFLRSILSRSVEVGRTNHSSQSVRSPVCSCLWAPAVPQSQLSNSPVQQWWASEGGREGGRGPNCSAQLISHLRLWDSQLSLLESCKKYFYYHITYTYDYISPKWISPQVYFIESRIIHSKFLDKPWQRHNSVITSLEFSSFLLFFLSLFEHEIRNISNSLTKTQNTRPLLSCIESYYRIEGDLPSSLW